MNTKLTLHVVNKLGTTRATANSITLYSLAPTITDESDFVFVVQTSPTIKESISDIINNNIFEKPEEFNAIGTLHNIAFNGHAYSNVKAQEEYAQAILPDWVDVYTDEIPRQPWQKDIVPEYSLNDTTIEDESIITIDGNGLNDGKVYVMLPEKEIDNEEYFIGKIGKLSWTVKQTDEIFVEYCDNKIDVIHQYSLDMNIPSVSTTVLMKVDVSIDAGANGDSEGLKSLEILSNKNNFIDVYIDMDNIMRIDNLPSGLIYENNHVKGTPTKSGLFISTIVIGTPTAGITAKYTIRFKIPVFERLL